jgi:hypothetical protein
MYVEIGNCIVENGAILPCAEIDDHHLFEWTGSDEDYCTLVVLHSQTGFVHLLTVNITRGEDEVREGEAIFDWIRPGITATDYSTYEVYLLRQSRVIKQAWVDNRSNFDWERWTDCELYVIESFTFSLDPHVESVVPPKSSLPLESIDVTTISRAPSGEGMSYEPLERFYDVSDLSDDDLDVLGQVYGIQNPSSTESLEREEILKRIQKIIVFEGEK